MNSLRVIPTKTHAILDYSSVVLLTILPHLLNANSRTKAVAGGAAGKVLLSSLCTRYELGVLKMLPMKGHLAMDFATGSSLLGYAQSAKDENAGARAALAALGAVAIAASVLTRDQSPEELLAE